MAEMIIGKETGEQAVLGGAVLGGGGGGSMESGREKAAEALRLGVVRLVDGEDLSPDDIVITGSAVGAPSSRNARTAPRDHARAVELLMENGCPKPAGFIPNECGGGSIVNGWIPAAVMGLPVVDILCNGRAHPTGPMGSMGLHTKEGYLSRQAVAGGDPATSHYLEMHAAGKLDLIAPLVRAAADKAGGLVAVARNPVTVSYARRFGAPKALKQAIALGEAMQRARARGAEAAVKAAADFLGGEIVTLGTVGACELTTHGGFDSGLIRIGEYEATFWNEYMTLERGSLRAATFPDLIMTFDASDGMPVTTAEVRQGQRLYLIRAPASNLILGEGMRCPDLLRAIEPVVRKSVLEFAAL